MKSIGPEHAERRLQRIGLLRPAALSARAAIRAGCRAAATGTETSAATVAKSAATDGAARVRDETFVEGLLERVRDRRRIEIDVFVVVTPIGIAVDHALVREVLRRRCLAIAARSALAIVRSNVLSAALAIVALLAALPRLVATAVVVAAARATRALVVVVVVALGSRRALAAREATDHAHVAFFEVDPHAALQPERQHHGAVANADQPAYREPASVEKLAHLAVAALGDDDAVPVVRTVAATVDDRLEAGLLTLDVDAFEQARLMCFGQRAEKADRVLALDAEAGMHQLVREFTGVREQQQAFGVDVEPADRLPLALLQSRKTTEHGRPVLRIVMRDDLSDRLVVRDDARRRWHDAQLHRLAVDLHAVAERDALADMRRLAVDFHMAVGDQVLHVAARADTRLREHLVQLGRIGLGQQHALRRRRVVFGDFDLGLGLAVDVELARQHLREQLAGLDRCRRCHGHGRAVCAGRIARLAAFTAFAVASATTAAARAVAWLLGFLRRVAIGVVARVWRCIGARCDVHRSRCRRGRLGLYDGCGRPRIAFDRRRRGDGAATLRLRRSSRGEGLAGGFVGGRRFRRDHSGLFAHFDRAALAHRFCRRVGALGGGGVRLGRQRSFRLDVHSWVPSGRHPPQAGRGDRGKGWGSARRLRQRVRRGWAR